MIGEKLARMKRERGLTTDELSKLSGVPRGTINNILISTSTSPKLSTLSKLANAMGYTIDDFNDFPHTPIESEDELKTRLEKYFNDFNIPDEKKARVAMVAMEIWMKIKNKGQ